MEIKCLYCESSNVGKFCSDCGKKAIGGFSIGNFQEIQEYIFGNDMGENHLSKYFSPEVKIRGIMQTQWSLYKDLKRWGYLFRVTEEKFGSVPNIHDRDFQNLLSDKNSSISKRLKEATDYLDTRINTISIDGLHKDYLIIPEIASLFTEYIGKNIDNIIQYAQEGKLDFSLKKSTDLEALAEVLFRNAVWGYLYRIAEEQLKNN